MLEPHLGEIKMFGGHDAPRGWAICNGQLLAIAEHDALFNLLGTTYGGDGVSTFALPDLRGRLPVHSIASVAPTQITAHGHACQGTSAGSMGIASGAWPRDLVQPHLCNAFIIALEGICPSQGRGGDARWQAARAIRGSAATTLTK
ncbi:Microcystin dependent protein [Minicystis rosea]|nr:Microcystin dependent protein [Minicystis rosea]